MSATPEQEAADLANLKAMPGWALFVAHFRKARDIVRDGAMEERDDETANRQRAAWQKLCEFDPERLRQSAENSAHGLAKRANGGA